MKRFKSARHLQRFVSIHDPVANLFHIPRHDTPSDNHRELRADAMKMWNGIARLKTAQAKAEGEIFGRTALSLQCPLM